VDEDNRTPPWVSRFHDVELDAPTACDFVTLHHVPHLLALRPNGSS